MRLVTFTVVLALTACVGPPPAGTTSRPSELDGRVAGTPQGCVSIERDLSLRVADGDRNLLLYGYGQRIWANRLPAGCGLNQGNTLVVQTIGLDYCRGDFVRSLDPVSRFPGPSCYLGDFVPYTRPRR